MAESFFIEPLTGNAHPITSDNFLGIESLWNHQNYWVNMQDCSEGVKVPAIANPSLLLHDLNVVCLLTRFLHNTFRLDRNCVTTWETVPCGNSSF